MGVFGAGVEEVEEEGGIEGYQEVEELQEEEHVAANRNRPGLIIIIIQL